MSAGTFTPSALSVVFTTAVQERRTCKAWHSNAVRLAGWRPWQPSLPCLTHVLGLKAVHLPHQHVQAALCRQAEQPVIALACGKTHNNSWCMLGERSPRTGKASTGDAQCVTVVRAQTTWLRRRALTTPVLLVQLAGGRHVLQAHRVEVLAAQVPLSTSWTGACGACT